MKYLGVRLCYVFAAKNGLSSQFSSEEAKATWLCQSQRPRLEDPHLYCGNFSLSLRGMKTNEKSDLFIHQRSFYSQHPNSENVPPWGHFQPGSIYFNVRQNFSSSIYIRSPQEEMIDIPSDHCLYVPGVTQHGLVTEDYQGPNADIPWMTVFRMDLFSTYQDTEGMLIYYPPPQDSTYFPHQMLK